MKVAFEIEGKYRGQNMVSLFCSASELDAALKLRPSSLWEYLAGAEEHFATQLYISDHDNLLSYTDTRLRQAVQSYSVVTLEVTQVKDQYRPAGLELMYVASTEPSFKRLLDKDQVKLTNEQFVYAVSVRNLVVTLPEDFDNDITL